MGVGPQCLLYLLHYYGMDQHALENLSCTYSSQHPLRPVRMVLIFHNSRFADIHI